MNADFSTFFRQCNQGEASTSSEVVLHELLLRLELSATLTWKISGRVVLFARQLGYFFPEGCAVVTLGI